MRIKTGDTVKILSGKDRGKTGKITHVFVKDNRVVVEGVNVRKKHMRPKKQGQAGQVIQMPMPVDESTAMLVCSACGKPTRIERKIIGNKKARICKKCKAEIVY